MMLVVKTEDLKPYVERCVERCGRAGLSDSTLRRVYGIIVSETEWTTHHVADCVLVAFGHPELLQFLPTWEVDFRAKNASATAA